MLKKHMAACLVASAFMTVPVLAQTSSGATSPGADHPATSASGSTGGSAAAASAGGRFITQQQQNQWRASKLIGINVYGADNERIGDVNEVLVDRNGNADAVVVGVGGFLGIGEKNVALPFNAFEWQMDDNRRTASAGSTSGSSTSGSSASTAARTGDTTASTGPASNTAARSTDAAGTTASTNNAANTGAAARSNNADRGYPDHAVLRMTKADLEKAPTFRYMGDRSSDDRSGNANRSGTGTGATTGTGTGTGAAGGTSAPRQ